jgi:Restriction endonuclease
MVAQRYLRDQRSSAAIRSWALRSARAEKFPETAATALVRVLRAAEAVLWFGTGRLDDDVVAVVITDERVVVVSETGRPPQAGKRSKAVVAPQGSGSWRLRLRVWGAWIGVEMREAPPSRLVGREAGDVTPAVEPRAEAPPELTAPQPDVDRGPAPAPAPTGEDAVIGETPDRRVEVTPAAGATQIRTWRQAEEWAAWHMRTLGFTDSQVTRSSADGGLDVDGSRAVGQVKHHRVPAGSPAVQQLQGAGEGRETKVFYCLSGFTSAAKAYAEQTGMALFAYDESGHVTPHSTAALTLMERPSPWRPVQSVQKARAAADRAQKQLEKEVADFTKEVAATRRRLRAAKGWRASSAQVDLDRHIEQVETIVATYRRQTKPPREVKRAAWRVWRSTVAITRLVR